MRVSNGPGGVASGTNSPVPVENIFSAIPEVAGQPVGSDPSVPGGIIVAGSSIAPGQIVTVSGTRVLNSALGVVVGAGSPVPASNIPALNPNVLGQSVQADPSVSGGVILAGTAIKPSQMVTVSGTRILVGSSGIAIGANAPVPLGVILASPAPTPGTGVNSATRNAAGSTVQQIVFTDPSGRVHTAVENIQPGSTAVVDGTITLNIGGAPQVVDGKTLSLASDGIVVDGTTTPFIKTTGSSGSIEEQATYNHAIVDWSITLILGRSPTTIDGSILSLAPNGLVINGSASPFSFATLSATSAERVAIYTDAQGRTHSVVEMNGESGTAVIDESVTITLGGEGTVVDGDTVSLASSGVVVDGTTRAFVAATTTETSSGPSPTSSNAGPSAGLDEQASEALSRRSCSQRLLTSMYALSALFALLMWISGSSALHHIHDIGTRCKH
ncbi:MAG: hypothetical protein M1820_008839 [Bogoriella megaspora]|nr:MAG: hypothetical protein M1820_008839 [Bogoriella megaspora]